MNLVKENINNDIAAIIAKWSYTDEYSFYNIINEEGIMDELLNSEYYAVCDGIELIGFYCIGKESQVPNDAVNEIYADDRYIDIGLGMKPELTDRGYGREFVGFIMECTKEEYDKKKLRLTVAAFNQRAMKVYRALGFNQIASFVRESDNIEFIIMVCDIL